MNVDKLKEDAEFCKEHNFTSMASVAPQDVLDLIAAYEGAQFAAASHLRTVEQQAKIIAGMQAARNQALEEAAELASDFDNVEQRWAGQVYDDASGTKWAIANAIRALKSVASTPSAAMQGQGVLAGWKLVPVEPTDEMAVAAIKVALFNPAINGVETYRAMLAAAPTPAAQPQAGGRELTAEVALDICDDLMRDLEFDPEERMGVYQVKQKIAAHITGTKGAT